MRRGGRQRREGRIVTRGAGSRTNSSNISLDCSSRSSSLCDSNTNEQLPRQSDDDEDWMDSTEDGVLFSVIATGADHSMPFVDDHHGGDLSVPSCTRGRQVGDGRRPMFDSISDTSTVSLDRQITTFHLETERTLASLLQRLREQTMSLSAMEQAEGVIRSSSPIEWNPYRPPRGERYRERLEAMQVLEWKEFAMEHFGVEGVNVWGTSAVASNGDSGTVWVPFVGDPNQEGLSGSVVDVTDAMPLEVHGVSAACAFRHYQDASLHDAQKIEDCALGGCTEEVIASRASVSSCSFDDTELFAVGDIDDAEVVVEQLDARRRRCGLPPLSPRSAIEEDAQDEKVLGWWSLFAEAMLRDAGLLQPRDGKCDSPFSDAHKGTSYDVLTFGEDAAMLNDPTPPLRQEPQSVRWQFEQKTPKKNDGTVNRFRRPSAPPSTTQTRPVELSGTCGESIGTSVMVEGAPSRSSRASMRRGLPSGRPQQHRKASSLSPPPRRSRSSEKPPTFGLSTDQPTAQRTPILVDPLLVVRGDTVPTKPPGTCAGSDCGTNQGTRPARVGGRLTPLAQASNEDPLPAQQGPTIRQRADSMRRLTREQQQAVLCALEGDLNQQVQQHTLLATAVAASSISGAFSILPENAQAPEMGMHIVGKPCTLNDRDVHHHTDEEGTSPGNDGERGGENQVRLPEINTHLHTSSASHHNQRRLLPPSSHVGAQHTAANTRVPHRAHTAYVRPSAKKTPL